MGVCAKDSAEVRVDIVFFDVWAKLFHLGVVVVTSSKSVCVKVCVTFASKHGEELARGNLRVLGYGAARRTSRGKLHGILRSTSHGTQGRSLHRIMREKSRGKLHRRI